MSIQTIVIPRRDGTFQVQMYINLGRDEMIECLKHNACFRTEAAAKVLAVKIQAAQKFDPAHWLWSASMCSPLAFMHVAPTANLYPVDR